VFSLATSEACFSRNRKNFANFPNTMASPLRFYSADVYKEMANKDSDLMIISDKKESFTSAFSALATAAGISHAGDVAFLSSVAEVRLIVSQESPSSVELFIQGSTATDPPRRVILALLPSKFSRHNSPSRSHSVASLVKSHKGSKKDFVVFLAPSSGDYLAPQAFAVARQFPQYSLKSSPGEEKKQIVTVVLYGYKTEPSRISVIANMAEGIQLAQSLVDSPPNVLHCTEYSNKCVQIAKALNCSVTVSYDTDTTVAVCQLFVF
jgi:M17 aminopeptidase N-terminal domain 2